jgi:hypothetical protein
MLEEPKIKKVDKRDKQLPQNFEQLIEMYDIEKIWPYIKRTIDYINNDLEKISVSSTKPTTNEKIWIQKGKNLFNLKNCSAKTQNGLTWTPNITNDTIDVTGTATGYSAVPLMQNFVPTEDFVISLNGKMSDATNVTTQVNLYKDGVSTDLGSIYSLDISEYDFDYITISLKRKSNVVTNTSVKVQIEYGTKITSYEAYVPRKIQTKNDNGNYEVFLDVEEMLNILQTNN